MNLCGALEINVELGGFLVGVLQLKGDGSQTLPGPPKVCRLIALFMGFGPLSYLLLGVENLKAPQP